MGANVPALPDLTKQLISEVAKEIGKELVAYIEIQYPDVFAAMNGGARLSFRNHVYNDIMSVLKCRTEADYRAWIEGRRKHRRTMLKMYRAYRSGDMDTMREAISEDRTP